MDGRSRQFIEALAARLDDLAEPATKEWWEAYLKGEAVFRGVKMADTRRTVVRLLGELGWGGSTIDARLQLAHACMEQTPTEDKLAGILILAEHSLHDLRIAHVPALARPLAGESLSDWNTVDWYCVKVLGPFITAGEDVRERAGAVAGWCRAPGLWQRRAAAVSFVSHAARADELFAGFHRLLIGVAEVNVTDEARWSQTSVGWLLRDLSRNHPALVLDFVNSHPELSTEARKNATKYL